MKSLYHSTDTTSFPSESMVWPQPAYRTSIFTSHQLKPDSPTIKPAAPFQPDWIVLLYLACFILLAWSQFFYAKRIRQIAKAPINQRFLNQLVRDGNLFKERIALTLGLLYLVNFAMVIYQLNLLRFHHSPFQLSGFTLYLAILAALFIYWLLKVMVIQLLGFIFKTHRNTHEYLLNSLVFCLNQGLVLLPLMVVTIFLKSETILYISLTIIALLFTFRVMRGFFIGLSLTRFSYLFLIVYLCTLEILPLLVMAKFISTNL